MHRSPLRSTERKKKADPPYDGKIKALEERLAVLK
jgi:hypothetical protein